MTSFNLAADVQSEPDSQDEYLDIIKSNPQDIKKVITLQTDMAKTLFSLASGIKEDVWK